MLDRYKFVCSSFFAHEARTLCLQTALSFSRTEQYECAFQLGDRSARNEAIAIPPPVTDGCRLPDSAWLTIKSDDGVDVAIVLEH